MSELSSIVQACSITRVAGEPVLELCAMAFYLGIEATIAAEPPHVPVATTGSVFRQSAEVRGVFYNRLRDEFPSIEIREELVDPVMGTLALARAWHRTKTAAQG